MNTAIRMNTAIAKVNKMLVEFSTTFESQCYQLDLAHLKLFSSLLIMIMGWNSEEFRQGKKCL